MTEVVTPTTKASYRQGKPHRGKNHKHRSNSGSFDASSISKWPQWPVTWAAGGQFQGNAVIPNEVATPYFPYVQGVDEMFVASPPKAFAPEGILGEWADSLGNNVHVVSVDAYEARLSATLSRPPRADVHLQVTPISHGAGWQCGNAVLDPYWSYLDELHWTADDGRVSVWIRRCERECGSTGSSVSYTDDNIAAKIN